MKHEDRAWKMEDGAAGAAVALYLLFSILYPRPLPCGPARRRGCGHAAALLLAVLSLSPLHAPAQASIQTLMANGPTSNRLNIVVLSEGYTSSQLAQFLVDATNLVNTLLSHPPYQ